MILVMPLMLLLSGCFDDSILDAMKSEKEFIAPFDVVVTLDKTRRSVYFPIADTGRLDIVKPGDDASYTDVPDASDFEIKLDVTLPDATLSDNDIVIDKVTGLVWTRCSLVAPVRRIQKLKKIDESDFDIITETITRTGSYYINNNNSCENAIVNDWEDLGDWEEDDGDLYKERKRDEVLNYKIEWANAVTSCEALNDLNDGQGYAGYKNWRLPRLPELLSIVDYEKLNPAIDGYYFPNTEHTTDEGYWTYTSQLFIDDDNNTTDNGWIVFFNSEVPQMGSFFGIPFEIPNITTFKQKLKSDLTFEMQFARCVTGGAD